MTVNSSTARQQYNGNGVTTAFTVPFRFLDNTHLQVIRTSAAGVDTTLVLSTDYTVTGAGAATGTITMVTAPASGEKLTIVRSMPFSQQIDLVNGDPLPAETLEAGLDARAMEAQQLKDAVSRSLSLPISSSASAVLPEAIPLALLGWNATGDALQSFAGAAGSPVSSFMAPAVAAADATAAQTAIGGTSVGRSVFSAANAAAARTAIGAIDGTTTVNLTGAQTVAGVKTFSSQPLLPQAPVLGTSVAATSGTAIDFTGIPSWARRVNVMFNAVSTSGTSYLMVRGGAGSVDATGYAVQASIGTTVYTETTGFIAYPGAVAAATTTGVLVLTLFSGNTWVCSSALCPTTTTASAVGVGTKTFSGALDRIRITALNGTDTFDAGFVNIAYE
jgi:hypothetical protein